MFEVFQQCFAATQAWNRALSLMERVPDWGPEAPMIAALGVVSDIQGFAVAVGILSDLFFPSGAGDEERGRRLRARYEVTDESRLRNAQIQVRHSLVHIDRELDRWLKGQVGRAVGPVRIEPWDGDAPVRAASTAARIIDNKNWRVFVLGTVLDLKPLIMEVGRIAVKYPLEFSGPSGERLILRIDPPH